VWTPSTSNDSSAQDPERICSLTSLREENSGSAAPGAWIRPFNYLVVATSIGGNTVCLGADAGAAFWADHSFFGASSISYRDQQSGQWIDAGPYTAESVRKSLLLLDDDIERFLKALLSDALEDPLDRLDGA
jgi:hypothetical protein